MTEDFEDKESIKSGDEDKSGKGKAGGGKASGGGIRLPPNKLAEVVKAFQYLDASKVAVRLAEFFSEMPARASANVQVNWANLRNHGFAIVTHMLAYGQEIARLMQNLTRENAERLRREYGITPSGP